MKMIRYIITVLFLFGITALSAQEKLSEEKRKEFEAQKVAFFTQELELTPEEAATFWPLYNEYAKKTREEEHKSREEIKGIVQSTDKLTEKQAETLINKMLDSEQNALNLKKEYYKKFMQVLPVEKVARLDWAERKFHRQLLNRAKSTTPPKTK